MQFSGRVLALLTDNPGSSPSITLTEYLIVRTFSLLFPRNPSSCSKQNNLSSDHLYETYLAKNLSVFSLIQANTSLALDMKGIF